MDHFVDFIQGQAALFYIKNTEIRAYFCNKPNKVCNNHQNSLLEVVFIT